MKFKKSKLTSALIKCTAAIVLGGVAGGAFADTPTKTPLTAPPLWVASWADSSVYTELSTSGVKSILFGPIMLAPNTSKPCDYTNITYQICPKGQTCTVNPLVNSQSSLKNWVEGGHHELHLMFGGWQGDETKGEPLVDPTQACLPDDYKTLIETSITNLGTTVSGVSFDIENNSFSSDKTKWDNLATTISKLKTDPKMSNLQITIIIPAWSSTWSGGYTGNLTKFLNNNSSNIDHLEFMIDDKTTDIGTQTTNSLNNIFDEGQWSSDWQNKVIMMPGDMKTLDQTKLNEDLQPVSGSKLAGMQFNVKEAVETGIQKDVLDMYIGVNDLPTGQPLPPASGGKCTAYTVQSGDYASKIAASECGGDGSNWNNVLFSDSGCSNKMTNTDLQPEQKIYYKCS